MNWNYVASFADATIYGNNIRCN